MPPKLFSRNFELFDSMLKDINNAKSIILLESHEVYGDKLGKAFKDALIIKAKEGVKVYVIFDGYWTNYKFFQDDFKKNGIHFKVFKPLVFTRKLIYRNSQRNHRKTLIIDGKISYIGSSNIDGHSRLWKDINLRFTGNIAKKFSKSFWDSWKMSDKIIINKKKYYKKLKYKDYTIILDLPSIRHTPTKKKLLDMINKAKESIILETPYFLPPYKFNKALIKAYRRGVDVLILLPKNSAVSFMNIVRHRITGNLFKHGIKIKFYQPSVNHSKVCLVDNKEFLMGSSNIDFRSFHLQYEINIYSKNKSVIKQIRAHLKDSINNTIDFDYENWKKRGFLHIVKEKFYWILREYL